MRLQELTDEPSYEAELSECAGVTGYHHWFFLTALADALRLRLRAFAVEDGGERLGVVPLLLRRRGPVSTVNYLPVPVIGPVLRGPALRAGRAAEMLGALEPVLLRQRVVATRWAFSPGLATKAERLAGRGFVVTETENFVVPGFQSVEAYLKGLTPKQRAAIRRAEQRGLSVGPSTAAEINEWLPRRLSAVTRQGTVSGYSLAGARLLARRLGPDPRVRWRSVRDHGGRTLVVNAGIVTADRLWGWLLAGDPVPGPSPHVAACFDAVKWALSQDLSCDFGSVPTSGSRDFMVAMGGEAELSAVAERVRPQVYARARALHGRLTTRPV